MGFDAQIAIDSVGEVPISQTASKEKTDYLKKVIVSGMLGNALEWYDFALYGYFASIIGRLFFPSTSEAASLMATFGVFAAGFLMRPIGGIIFGYIGDQIGRRNAFEWSIYLMAIPTAIIGFLPTYEHIGWWAPFILTLIRLSQGVSMGGGFTGAMVLVVENAEDGKRGYYGSWVIFSLLIGILLGSCIATATTTMLTEEQLLSWGWRVPFILSIAGAFIGSYTHKYLHETKEFEKAHKGGAHIPVMELINQNFKKILYVIAIELTLSIGFYLIVTFISNYLTTTVGLSRADALIINTSSLVAMGCAIPISGYLSDKIGRKPLLLLSGLGFVFFTYPLFQLLSGTPIISPMIAQMSLAFLMGMFFAPIPATLVELFPASIRCTGMAIAHSMSMTLFGGTAPLIATYLMKVTGDNTSPALYLSSAALISAVFLIKLKDRRKCNLQDF